jgi:Na+/H+-dicarboxylate symporter
VGGDCNGLRSARPGGVRSLLIIMIGFYITCLLFVFGVLGTMLWLAARVASSSWSNTWAANSC